MGKVVALCSGGFEHEAKAGVEIFRTIFALIRDMRRIVHHDIETPVAKWHMQVVTHNVWMKARINIQSNYRALTPPPKASSIDRGI